MRNKKTPHKIILNSDVLSFSVKVIDDMLGLKSASNVVYSDRTIVCHLLNAASAKTSISNVSDLCELAPSEGTIRYRFRNIELNELKQSLNETLQIHAPKIIPRKQIDLAIDYHNNPFYGVEENDGDTIKTQPKQGTSRFFAYATIYVILKNKRFTLAIKPIRKGNSLKDTVDFLIKEIRKAGFKIKTLFLDREFYNVKVINYLMKRNTSFIMPVVKRGSSGGIRELLIGKKSYSTYYIMRSKEDEATFQVNVAVKYSKRKYGRSGAKHFGYAVNNVDIDVKKNI